MDITATQPTPSYDKLPQSDNISDDQDIQTPRGCLPIQFTMIDAVYKCIPERPAFMSLRKALHKFYIKPTLQEFGELHSFIQYAQTSSERSLRTNINKWLTSKRNSEAAGCFSTFHTGNQQLKQHFHTLLLEHVKAHFEQFQEIIGPIEKTPRNEDSQSEQEKSEHNTTIEEITKKMVDNVFRTLKIDLTTAAPLSSDKVNLATALCNVISVWQMENLRSDNKNLKIAITNSNALITSLVPLMKRSDTEKIRAAISRFKTGVNEVTNTFVVEGRAINKIKFIYENKSDSKTALDASNDFINYYKNNISTSTDDPRLLGSSVLLKQKKELLTSIAKYLFSLATEQELDDQNVINDTPKEFFLIMLQIIMESDDKAKIKKADADLIDNPNSPISIYYTACCQHKEMIEEDDHHLYSLPQQHLAFLLYAANELVKADFTQTFSILQAFSPIVTLSEKEFKLQANPLMLEMPPSLVLEKVNKVITNLEDSWLDKVKKLYDQSKSEFTDYTFDWDNKSEPVMFTPEVSNQLSEQEEKNKSDKRMFLRQIKLLCAEINEINASKASKHNQLMQYKTKAVAVLREITNSKLARLTGSPETKNADTVSVTNGKKERSLDEQTHTSSNTENPDILYLYDYDDSKRHEFDKYTRNPIAEQSQPSESSDNDSEEIDVDNYVHEFKTKQAATDSPPNSSRASSSFMRNTANRLSNKLKKHAATAKQQIEQVVLANDDTNKIKAINNTIEKIMEAQAEYEVKQLLSELLEKKLFKKEREDKIKAVINWQSGSETCSASNG